MEKDLKRSKLKPDLFVDKPFHMMELIAHVKRLWGETMAKTS